MGYKTILVHVDDSKHAAGRVQHAARLAIEHNAHLVGSAFSGLSRFATPAIVIELAAASRPNLDAIEQHNRAALTQFDSIAEKEGVLSHERRLIDDDAAGELSLQARYADLVVMSQTDLDEPASAHLVGGLPEEVIMSGGRPVLLIPHAGQFAPIGRRVLLAWDGGLEATRAVAGAMPVLRKAAAVHIVEFKPAEAAGRQPGADLAQYLARHAVRCEVHVETMPIRAGEQLLSMASDLQSDLIVMGAYGQSRFREIFLGGVTETMLASMTTPVLLAH